VSFLREMHTRQETLAQPGKGGGHRTHLEDDGSRYLDRLRTREGPCGALLGQIALLAVPSTLARRAGKSKVLEPAKNPKTKIRKVNEIGTS
jgi:hypothetical protein